MDIDARAFGQLEGQVAALHQMMAAQNATLSLQNDTLAKLNTKLDLMSNTMSEAKGGWKTLIWLGGMAATAGGIVTWAVSHIPFAK
jgi:uncharacterized coiled-coil protein SlyX